MQTIHEIVRQKEDDYVSGPKQISKYVKFDQYENINKIDAYLNSKHITGDTDSQGREKTFFNIVVAAANIWFRATDIDRKNIRIKPTKGVQQILAFVASILLQNWMKKTAFGIFLNNWGRTLARYGSAVHKFVEKDGILHPLVIPWNRLICDPICFEGNPVIEKLEFTPAQLRKEKGYDPKMVKSLLTALETRKTLEGQQKDTEADYIAVYEAHGEFSQEIYRQSKGLKVRERNKDIYFQQMHVVSFVKGKEKGKFDDFTLYCGKEKDPYGITHLIEEDGRTQAIGSVEHLFDAQWMTNHSMKAIKDKLDLASKIIVQTADANFVGRNILSSIETGDILVHAANAPLTNVPNNSQDVSFLLAFANQWQAQGKEETATPDAMRSVRPPSGTPYSLEQLQVNEGYSLFEIMTENKQLAMEEMLREHIIPYLKKKMDNADEITATLEDYQITQIDSIYLPNEAIKRSNEKIKQDILNGKIVPPELQQMSIQAETENLQGGLNAMGNQRFFKPSEIKDKTWKKLLKDFEWEVEVDIPESHDKQATASALTSVFQTIVGMQGRPMTPDEKLVFNKLLNETSAVSPLELGTRPASPIGGGSVAGQPVMQQPTQ